MKGIDLNCYKGLTQGDYLQNRAFLDGFEPIESDWKELFYWIMSKGKRVCYSGDYGKVAGDIANLWKDHVLTVLVDIVKLDGNVQEKYVQIAGTDIQKQDGLNLKKDIESWIQRINKYLEMQLMSGEVPEKNSAVLVAQFIMKQLKDSLASVSGSNGVGHEISEAHCKMVNAVVDIKEKSNYYLQQIEDSGSLDPSLSLLLIFIRNYSMVVKRFNQSFSGLPQIYHNKILMANPRRTIQDRASLVITPSDQVNGFYLPEGTLFVAGKKEDKTELLYGTEKEEYISGMKIGNVFTIFKRERESQGKKKKIFHKQNIDIRATSPTPLFDEKKSSDFAYGWIVESNLFLMTGGEAEVTIKFELSRDSVKRLADFGFSTSDCDNSFVIYVSEAKGWSKKAYRLDYAECGESKQLVFTIKKHKINDAWVNACKEDHEFVSEFPLVRILANNENSPYAWAVLAEFTKVQVNVDVDDVQNIAVCNELGEIDTTKPFYPFGTTAGCGTWFRFGSEEILNKKVTQIKLEGVWNRLPPLDKGYKAVYENWYLKEKTTTDPTSDFNSEPIFPPKTQIEFERDLKIFDHSFIIQCERMENGKWSEDESQKQKRNLFCLDFKPGDDQGILTKKALIEFDINHLNENSFSSGAVVSDEKSGIDYPYRVTLTKPDIGFGTEEFRQIFAERMILKTKEEYSEWPLPAMPLVPVWEDLKLSYKASDTIDLLDKNRKKNGIRLSRVADLVDSSFTPIKKNEQQPFVQRFDDDYVLYLGVLNALLKRTIRMYFDMAFIKNEMSEEDLLNTDKPSPFEWHYISNGKWELLDTKYVLIDETCGLTQNGYIELELPNRINEDSLHDDQLFWLKVCITGNIDHCLAIRGIYMDYVSVVAKNGDGLSIPALAIKQLKEDNYRVKEIIQPLPGYGGKIMDSNELSLIHQMTRISTRNRALTPCDYEQLILERFSDIGKVCCISPFSQHLYYNSPISGVNIVVFAHTEDNKYPITPTWKLAEIRRYISAIISPLADIKVINPIYQSVEIKFVATVRKEAPQGGDTMKRMLANIWEYFADWKKSGKYPELGRCYSYKTLHTILANDKDVVTVFELMVDGHSSNNVDIESEDICIYGKTPWSVLVPSNINMELLLQNGGIGHLKIEYNFTIQ